MNNDTEKTTDTATVRRFGARVSEAIANPPNAIQAMRLLRDLSAHALEEKTGVQAQAIYRAERVGIGIGTARWNKIAKALGVSPGELHDPTLPARVIAREMNKKNKHSEATATA